MKSTRSRPFGLATGVDAYDRIAALGEQPNLGEHDHEPAAKCQYRFAIQDVVKPQVTPGREVSQSAALDMPGSDGLSHPTRFGVIERV